jgi:hypothetical protein
VAGPQLSFLKAGLDTVGKDLGDFLGLMTDDDHGLIGLHRGERLQHPMEKRPSG